MMHEGGGGGGGVNGTSWDYRDRLVFSEASIVGGSFKGRRIAVKVFFFLSIFYSTSIFYFLPLFSIFSCFCLRVVRATHTKML